MAHLSAQRLKITYHQTTDSLDLAFAIPGALGDEPAEKTATDDTLTLDWPPVRFEAAFFKPIRGVSARWKVAGRGRITVQLRKGQGQSGGWAQPFEQKLPFVFRNWDKYDPDDDLDEDDKPKGPPKPPDDKTLQKVDDIAKAFGGPGLAGIGAAATGGGVAPADELEMEMATRFFGAPPLYLRSSGVTEVDVADAGGESDVKQSDQQNGEEADHGYEWLNAWPSFRLEQRMVTMALFWNEMYQPTRMEAAVRLAKVLREGDASLNQLEGSVKGGDVARLKLDTSVYKDVARPARWLESFARMEGDEQVRVMELLFIALDYDAKKIVVATFM
jgi:hypothetical protein